ncbi:hypothetical protein VOLCADRAFT_93238 [Volvox carteri f. nagariensis]|uniref:Uncharacterized protein n=1 Tax=Volvox carteri f. nagariensis TaxID=3068 RepID=D8U1N0_VOLCA|nr:uncharacterized protein VOLCADRAFT_93238 [Volvox carteri f. nagariensis]EFJ46442.1 hypothetical protein VOLCADRAFT_93238 [Volvox carteri f. nagariensis]|eukprot:XP_002952595.1 hypothetical protein VOLCADRAFT_93238 [Volvox carteri f. nagariensis]
MLFNLNTKLRDETAKITLLLVELAEGREACRGVVDAKDRSGEELLQRQFAVVRSGHGQGHAAPISSHRKDSVAVRMQRVDFQRTKRDKAHWAFSCRCFDYYQEYAQKSARLHEGMRIIAKVQGLKENALAPEQKPEKLQRLVELAKDIKSRAQKEPEAVAIAISVATGMLPPVPLERALRVMKDLPAAAQEHLPAATDLLASIRELGTAAECLEHPNTPHGSPRRLSYLIAANLYECEAIMPFWILEVLRLALMLRNDQYLQLAYFNNDTKPAFTSSVSISIYESGSKDTTTTWLRIAEALWTAAGIPNTVVINGLLTRQTLMDPYSGAFYKQHRIEYLASLRNAALEPVYQSPEGTYNFVIFINDAFEADIGCGLDFEVWIGNKKGRVSGVTQRFLRRRLMSGESDQAASTISGSTAIPGITWQTAIEHMSKVHVEEAARQAAADSRVQAAPIKPRYEFYDTWVSRDVGGAPYVKTDPIARDFRTIDLLHRGLPFPVKCCWNGMVILNATHLARGLRFRASLTAEGEYDISECSLFCEDYRRLGATDVVVDPSVRVSYLVWTKDFHGKLPGGVGAKVPWALLARSGAFDELKKLFKETKSDMKMTWVPLSKSLFCVVLLVGSFLRVNLTLFPYPAPCRKFAEEADLDKGRVIDLASVNYTGIFLDRLKNPPPPPPKPPTCNLIMGPYGSTADGHLFDDLAMSAFGQNPITKIRYSNTTAMESLQVEYASRPGLIRGVQNNTVDVAFASGEAIDRAIVFFTFKEVKGMIFTTSTGRNVSLGVTDGEEAGKYRLISFAGTADKTLRSVSLVWASKHQ